MAGLDVAKFVFKWFQKFVFMVVMVLSILIETTYWETSIPGQLVVKISWRADKNKITFKAIEYRYGLQKTVSNTFVYWSHEPGIHCR